MKKRSILVILLLVFLAGCGKEAGTAGTGGARFTQKQIEEFHTLSREAAFVWLGDSALSNDMTPWRKPPLCGEKDISRGQSDKSLSGEPPPSAAWP